MWAPMATTTSQKGLYQHDNLGGRQSVHAGPRPTLRIKSLEDIAAALKLTPAQLTAQVDAKVCQRGIAAASAANSHRLPSSASLSKTPRLDVAVIAMLSSGDALPIGASDNTQEHRRVAWYLNSRHRALRLGISSLLLD
jgi:hypothetical protein